MYGATEKPWGKYNQQANTSSEILFTPNIYRYICAFVYLYMCVCVCEWKHKKLFIWLYNIYNRGVMFIVAGIGHGDTSSNPGLIAFHIALIPLGKVWIQLF